MTHEPHLNSLVAAFADVLKAEHCLAELKADLAEKTARSKAAIGETETELTAAWATIAGLMSETGEFEVTLPGAATDYRIGWSAPRESVKADPAATPDEFCQVERKPKLKEIGEHLKALRSGNLPFPNWASLEAGDRKLQWKAVKRK